PGRERARPGRDGGVVRAPVRGALPRHARFRWVDGVAAVRRAAPAGHALDRRPRRDRARCRPRRGRCDPVDAHRPRRRRAGGVTPVLSAGAGTAFAQTVLDGPLLLAVLVPALAGAVSFASPCVLPLVPGYVGYVTGLSGATLEDRRTSRVVLGIGLFVLGFAVVFVALGAAFSTLGMLLNQWMDVVNRVLGVIVILAGVVFLGGIPF